MDAYFIYNSKNQKQKSRHKNRIKFRTMALMVATNWIYAGNISKVHGTGTNSSRYVAGNSTLKNIYDDCNDQAS